VTLLDKRVTYKPFKYPWAYEGWLKQQKMHWLPEEVPMHEDVRDWNKKLTPEEKNLLTQIFRFFTQGDVDVAKAYNHKYIPIFGGNPEVLMMLDAFANIEGVHIAAYSTLLDTVGMPEVEYRAFMKYEAMKAKHEYTEGFEIPITGIHLNVASGESAVIVSNEDRLRSVAKSLAIYSAFTEGMQLFSSFAILLNFARFNKMKGMCQIVTWSVRDESLHTEYMIKLFRQFIKENKSIWTDDFKKEIYDVCRTMVELEDNFIDLAFEQGGIEGLAPEEVKKYVRYIADRRLLQLGLKTNFGVKKNPLDWLDSLLNGVEHANFFEARATEYSKANTKGTWDKVWEAHDKNKQQLEVDLLTTGTAIINDNGDRIDPFVLTPHIETKGN
jgi:ribonucleoside-diphosphate reductase beta chain